MSRPTIVIQLDGVLGDTRPVWNAFIEHLARRFSAIEPLVPSSLSDDRVRAAEQLDAWAASGVGDWRGQLTRFAEDHLPVHLRPNARASAALRSLSSAHAAVEVVSDAPQELVDVAAAHLGLTRLAARSTGGVSERDHAAATTYISSPAELEALLSDG